MATRNVRPFAAHNCTTSVHNALLDSIMPAISSNAWKLLCFIIRQTDGWNREETGLSYTDLMRGTGIRARPTIASALKELLNLKLLTRARFDDQSEMRYSLNLNAEIPWIPFNASSKNELPPSSKNELPPSSKNELPPSSKNELHVMKESSILVLKQKEGKKGEVVDSKNAKQATRRNAQESPLADDFLEPLPKGLEPIKRTIATACGFKNTADWRTSDELTTQALILNSQGITVEEIRETVGANPKKHFKLKFFAQDVLALRGAAERSESGGYVHKAQNACRAGGDCGGGGVLVVIGANGQPSPTQCECYGMT